jgi:hypothetical protein
MSARVALISLAGILCCCRLAAVWGANPPQVAEQLVMLRNGEILRGHVTRQDDHYQVSIADGELRLRAVDVDLICQTLEQAYQARRARLTVGRADDHLDLADWCLRQGLPGEAARELSSALALEPGNPRIGLIDRRLQEALAPPAAPTATKITTGPRVTDEDLDRMLRALPPVAIESFTTSIQPLLISSCAAAGCHGSANKGNYSLIRVPADRFSSRRLTQRNLHATLSWVDFQNPQQSRLMAVVSQPHGTVTSGVFDAQGSKYRQLLIWVGMVTQKPVWESDIASQPATIRPAAVNPAEPGISRINPAFAHSSPPSDGGGTWPSDEIPATAAADADTRPVHASHHFRPAKAAATPSSTATATRSEGAAVAKRPPSGADPYDPESFNRQFADVGKTDAPPQPAAPPNQK